MNQTHAPRMEEVMSLLDKHGESTTKRLAEHANATEKEIRDAINRLEEREIVESRPDPNPARRNGKLRSLSGDPNE